MGAKFSKAAWPRREARRPSVITGVNENESTPATQSSDATSELQIPDTLSHNDNTVTASPTSPAFPESHSEQTPTNQDTTNPIMEQLTENPVAENSSLVPAEQGLLLIEYGGTDAGPPPPPPVPYTPPPPPEPAYQCLICCVDLPREKESRHADEVIKPCNSCDMPYCVNCVKTMFLKASKDTTRMPPRCCKPIHLHHVRSHLTAEEIATFKAKYEEFLTPKPFYCPIPTCSAFIPDRLQPTKGRVDSGVGTPTSQTFPCPSCKSDVCLSCRQAAHPESNCQIDEFGIDAETWALLSQWGYKKCPKCGNGVKRMYGCTHMECRCGSHWCWVCLEDKEDCDGGCYDEDYSDREDEPDEPEDTNPEPANAAVETAEGNAPEAAATAEASMAEARQTQPAPRPRNLDGGSHRYWEERSDVDFGDEPTEDIQDRSWSCTHRFSTYTVSLASALTKDPSALEMECVKCWSVIHPEIAAKYSQTEIRVPVRARRVRMNVTRRGGRRRPTYAPPRGLLFRDNTTVGTAPHLTAPVSFLSQSAPTREASPMDGILANRIVDTRGNPLSTEANAPRRASIDTIMHDTEFSESREAAKNFQFTFSAPSNIFTTNAPKFSLAYECARCSLLLCETCKKGVDESGRSREV